MLVERVYTSREKSKYTCDKCGKFINTDKEKRFKISIDTPKLNRSSAMDIVRRYDLCKRCTSVIIGYVEKKGK